MSTDNIFAGILFVFGLFGSSMAYLVKGLVTRVGRNEDACGQIKITLGILEAKHDGIAEAIAGLRAEMSSWQKDLREQIGKVHERVNEIAKG